MNSPPTLLATDVWSSIDGWLSEYRIAWIWCVVQITFVVTCAAGIYAIVHRRGSNVRFQIMLTSLCLVIGLSLVAFSPWPRWWTVTSSQNLNSTDTIASDSTKTPTLDSKNSDQENVADNASINSLPTSGLPEDAKNQSWLAILAQQLESTRDQPVPASLPATPLNEAESTAKRSTSAKTNWLSYVTFFVLACVGWGLVRLFVGWLAINRLKTRSTEITDATVSEHLDILCAQIGCQKNVQLRETDELVTAATIGWKNATILLPSNWRSWSELERRAILAHELAHISRNDFAFGCLAQLSLAIHFYHPLVHWLVRRFQLEQELVADAAAALLVGSQRKYTTTLVELALRQPSRPVSWPAQAFLPTRKTFMRRIEVLRDHETLQKSLAALPRTLAVGLLLVAGVAAAGLRNPVQQILPAANANEPRKLSPEKPFVQLAAADDSVVSSADSEEKEEAGQPPMVVEYVPQNADWVLASRPKVILNTKIVGPIMKPLEESFPRGFVPGIQLADIDQLTFAFFRPVAGSSNYVVICRSNEKRDWIAHCQQSTSVDFFKKPLDAKRNYYEIPGQKPGVNFICQIDEQTLIVGDEANLMLAAKSASSSPPLLDSPEWEKGLDGDLVASSKMATLLAMAQTNPNAASSLNSVLGVLSDAEQATFSLDVSDTEIDSDLTLKFKDSQKANAGSELLNALRIVGANNLKQTYDRYQKVDRGEFPAGLETRVAAMGLAIDMLNNLSIDVTEETVHASNQIKLTPEMLEAWLKLQTSLKQSATDTRSRNKMRQILIGMHNFYDRYQAFPPASAQKPNTKARHSWRVAILPFIDQSELYEQYNFDEPWDSKQNKQLLSQMPQMYASPGMDQSKGMTKYLAIVGSDTVITSDQPTGDKGHDGTRMQDITDGTSNTIMFVEAKKLVPWTKPEDLPFDADQPFDEITKQLAKTFLIGLTDGSVRQVTISDDDETQKTFKGAFTRSGDEAINIKKLFEPQASTQNRQAPSGRKARPDKMSPANRLKTIGLGLHNFHDIYTSFPPASAQKPNTKARHSWRVAILPFIGQKELYEQYNFDEPWDSEENKELLSQMPDAFAAGDEKDAQGLTPILAIVGSDTIITSDKRSGNKGYEGTKIQEVTDGTSNTIAVVESKHRVPWTKPEDIPYDKTKPFDSTKWLNSAGYNALISDGSILSMKPFDPKNEADIQKLRALFSRNGDERVKF